MNKEPNSKKVSVQFRRCKVVIYKTFSWQKKEIHTVFRNIKMRFRGIISETGRIRKFDNIMTAISKIAKSCVLQFDHGWCKDNFNPSHPSNKHNYFTFL